MADDPRQGGVRYDERGRPYIQMANGRRNYISPAAFGQPVPADETGIFRQAPQWNNEKGEWETPIDWTNVANMATIGGLTAGAGNMIMAGGAPAAGGGGAAVLPSSSLPVGLTTAPSAVAGTASATVPLSAAVPASFAAPAAAPAAAPVATQAGGVTGGILPGAAPSTTATVANGTIAATAPTVAAPTTIAGMSPLTLALTGGSMLANYFSARSAANASRDAARMQAESAERALAFQQRMWEDTQRNQQPWLQAGTGAINTMANLTGVPMLAPGSTSTRQPRPPTGGGPNPPLAPGVTMPLASAAPRSVGSGATPAANRPALVSLQAPDGSTQQVPEQFASAFEARGARRVA